MKIGIIALGLKAAKAGGIEIYFRNLIKSLHEFDRENVYYIFLNNKDIKNAIAPYCNSKIKLKYQYDYSQGLFRYIPFALLVLCMQPEYFFKLLMNRFYKILFSKNLYDVDIRKVYNLIHGRTKGLDRYELDIVHCPFTIIQPSLFSVKSPIVLTIHDIQQEYYPEFFDNAILDSRRESYRPGAERANLIIAISEATKKTLVEKYNIKPEKIVVAYQGCAQDFKKIEDESILMTVRKKYNLPDEFIFYPASTWPHKNHIKLLEAISICKKRYSFEKKLVLTGIPMNNHNNIMETVEKLGLKDQVEFLHFVPFNDVPAIYNLATIMVFPSVFEGFGIPLVEAMSVGLPIACSDRTSIPEVVGDAGVYFNPDSAEDIAEKVYQLWEDEELRKKLIGKGFERAKRLTWEQGVKATLLAYQKAAKGQVRSTH